jgi:hypothetical protein
MEFTIDLEAGQSLTPAEARRLAFCLIEGRQHGRGFGVMTAQPVEAEVPVHNWQVGTVRARPPVTPESEQLIKMWTMWMRGQGRAERTITTDVQTVWAAGLALPGGTHQHLLDEPSGGSM